MTQNEPLDVDEFIKEAQKRGFHLRPAALRELYRHRLLIPFVQITSRPVRRVIARTPKPSQFLLDRMEQFRESSARDCAGGLSQLVARLVRDSAVCQVNRDRTNRTAWRPVSVPSRRYPTMPLGDGYEARRVQVKYRGDNGEFTDTTLDGLPGRAASHAPGVIRAAAIELIAHARQRPGPSSRIASGQVFPGPGGHVYRFLPNARARKSRVAANERVSACSW